MPRIHRSATLAIILSVIVALGGSLSGQQPAKSTAPAARTAPAAAPPVDGGWPRAYTTGTGAKLVLYQPQISSWAQQRHITGYAAVSYLPVGAAKAALGTIKIEADTEVSVAERLVNFTDFTIAEANFSTLPKEQLRSVIAEISQTVSREDRVIALDRVLESVDTSLIVPANNEGVKADPPTIFYSAKPAVLVILDGEPIWSPIEGNDLKFAVNTNWDLFQHEVTKSYFLRVNTGWMTAAAIQGPWTPAGTLPESFKKLPADANWKAVKAAVPGKAIEKGKASNVFVSTTPAEMLLLNGQPSYLAVGATPLLWVNNTESDVFRAGKNGLVYFLVAGRWFSAPSFAGPWTFATLTLPEDFKKIPLEHPRSRVLASVPGTPKSAEAVLLAQVPQTATINRKDIKAPEVVYQGTPEFAPIEKTTVSRAVNTDKDIIKVGDLYYMCFQGVWFMSKSATGPWEASSDVPKAIYEIPTSSPSHSVTYVAVQSSTPTTVVYMASPAYMGMMVAWGCVVWGTGYYYPPYVRYGGYYPIYYPHYPTYGYGASYNPWTGAYSRGVVAYGPYGGAGMASRYNPRTGTYSRGAVAYGPYGAAGSAQAYNPRTGAYGQTKQGANAYGSWGSTSVQRGDQWANTQRTTNNATGVTKRTTQSSAGTSVRVTGPGGNTTAVGRSNSGDLYAGHDGNVYKKEQGGGFQKYENGGWSSTERPAQQRDGSAASGAGAATGQLNADAAARAQGAQRTRDAGRVSSGAARSSSYRPSSGGARSGGGRRR
jgi:hypothetical protein